jgi:hypothetical protein
MRLGGPLRGLRVDGRRLVHLKSRRWRDGVMDGEVGTQNGTGSLRHFLRHAARNFLQPQLKTRLNKPRLRICKG